jgi:hypothetical protein
MSARPSWPDISIKISAASVKLFLLWLPIEIGDIAPLELAENIKQKSNEAFKYNINKLFIIMKI